MSTLTAMRKTLNNPAQFQRCTMEFYRTLVLDMLQEPRYHCQRVGLFVALRTITEWQRAGIDDFTRFYEDYRNVTHEVDTAEQSAAARVYGEAEA